MASIQNLSNNIILFLSKLRLVSLELSLALLASVSGTQP